MTRISKKAELPVARIKFHGLFDHQGLLRTMREWMLNNGYEFQEKSYKHKVPSPDGYEQEFKWSGWRKVSGYVKFWINVYMKYYDMNDVDVVKEGVKKKMTQGRFIMEIDGYVELDYNGYFEIGNSKLLLGLRDWIHKYLLFTKIASGWTDELYYRMYKLHHTVKQFLGMSTPTDSSRYRY